MDPALAAPIATVAGAVATAILMWASYNYPRGYHRGDAERDLRGNRGRDRNEDDEDADADSDDSEEYRPPRHAATRRPVKKTKDGRHGTHR